MEKLVVVIDRKSKSDPVKVADKIREMPGLSVTATSKSFIDVEAMESDAIDNLQEFVSSNGYSVQSVTHAELIEPISPSK